MLAPSIIEGTALDGTGIKSLYDLINTKEDIEQHNAEFDLLESSLNAKAGKSELYPKVYERDYVRSMVSHFPTDTGIFFIEEPDIITLPADTSQIPVTPHD